MNAPSPEPDPTLRSSPTTRPSPTTRRAAAVRHLLSPHQLRESLALAPQPRLRVSLVAGLQAALTTLVALPLVALSSWPHVIGFASLGSLVALFGRFAPPRADRSRIVLHCLFWQTLSVTAISTAAWLGTPAWFQLTLVSFGCGVFFHASTAGRFGPPGALIFVFATSASMGPLNTATEVVERAAATLVVGVLAWAICLATASLRQRRDTASEFPSEPAAWPFPRCCAQRHLIRPPRRHSSARHLRQQGGGIPGAILLLARALRCLAP